MKIAIACGGTGGHVLPGVSIATRFDGEVVFLLSKRGMDMVSDDYRRLEIPAMPLRGGGLRRKLLFFLAAIPSFVRSLRILLRERADFVVGTGGYASFLPLVAACSLGIPTAVQEQNVMPGLTTRALARIVDRVFVSYEETRRWLPDRNLLVTGNPVREEIGRVAKSEAVRYFGLEADEPIVLISGGSQGAHRINSAFVEMLDLLPDGQKLQFITLTGTEDVKWVKGCVETRPFRTLIFDFLNEIEYAYAASDLVVARAGATTISELLQCGKPSILIPYPHAAGHQRLNALLLERNGAASVLEDEVLTGRVLEREISRILDDRSRLLEMAENARTLAKPDPAAAVVGEILRCLGT